MVEEEIVKRYSEQEMRCPTHLCIGQEAIAVGVCANLQKKDKVFSYHRSHGHYLAKGGNLPKFIAELYGKATGCSGGIGGSQHLIDLSVNFSGAIPIVGETIPLAIGAAMAAIMKKDNRITVTFLGDAAVEEGVFSESLNFASLKKLPILFVCENNFYSISTPMIDRQPKREIYTFAKAFKIASYQMDGNDVVKVYQLTHKAIDYIRHRRGPVFLEFLTYRLREHCGPNFEPEGWRPKEEVDYWTKRSPIERLKRHLIDKKILTLDQIKRLKQKIEEEISIAFKFAKESPFPDQDLSEDMVYA